MSYLRIDESTGELSVVAPFRRKGSVPAKFAEIPSGVGGGSRRDVLLARHRSIPCRYKIFSNSDGSVTTVTYSDGYTRTFRNRTHGGWVRAFNAAHKRAYDLVLAPETRLLLGCDLKTFKAHIEAQFLPGMTWDNYGGNGPWEGRWELDHIRPCQSFDMECEADQRACFHYSNVRPLWVVDNRKRKYHG